MTPPGLLVERRAVLDGVVEISGRLAGAAGCGPDCGTPSSSCHSRYVRTLSDLPISGAVVKLRLSVRRFRCKQGSCRGKTFGEALAPSLGGRHGRRVARCDGLLHAVGLALGGRPGARTMARLAAPWSKDIYAWRAGVKATMSWAVRSFGLRTACYVGLAKVRLQHIATAAAINLIRLTRWSMGAPIASTRASPFVSLLRLPV